MTKQEKIAGALLALANSAFGEGLAVGKKRSLCANQNAGDVTYSQCRDASATLVVSVAKAMPGFVLALRDSKKHDDFMVAAKLLMELRDDPS